MADHGADVIKIDPVALQSGLAIRLSAIDGFDLDHPESQALIRKLIAETDVLIHNFRPGVMDRLNLGASTLRAQNPRKVPQR